MHWQWSKLGVPVYREESPGKQKATCLLALPGCVPCRTVVNIFWIFKRNWKLDFRFTFQIKMEGRVHSLCEAKKCLQAQFGQWGYQLATCCVLIKPKFVKAPEVPYARVGLHWTIKCSRNFRARHSVASFFILPSNNIFLLKTPEKKTHTYTHSTTV